MQKTESERVILSPDDVTSDNFEEMLPELIDSRKNCDYKFLLLVCNNITVDQIEVLEPYIVDRFITENFEEAEWEGRFSVLENAKEIYARDMFGANPDFIKVPITDSQDIFISNGYYHETLDCLIVPTKMFETDLSPFEIIVYTLRMDWHKSYSNIAETLNRSPKTIETVFKRAVFKLRDVE